MWILGFDIGGTKCAVTVGHNEQEQISIVSKQIIQTDLSISPELMISKLCAAADSLLAGVKAERIGISCGGPLNSKTGRILNPPNLTGWIDVPIVALVERHYGVPTHLQNDANACAIAEWKFGAGRGLTNMIFLTFGTGLGAGLILNGQLYTGSNDMAGEIGHVRLNTYGPVGYGKKGSFEGFCSGSGLAQIGYTLAIEALQKGTRPLYFPKGATEEDVTAKVIADAAEKQDVTAKEVYRLSGEYLGRGLSILLDTLNPQAIVIGSVYARSEHLLFESMSEVIQKEALLQTLSACKILPAQLGDMLGDYAALATALL